MKTLQLQPCSPPIWARSGHAQTLLGHFLKSPVLSELRKRVEVQLPDGDRLVGSFIQGTSRTTVTLFHGLTGSSESTYMHRTARIARARGHSVLLMNHRGCGEGKGFARLPYHSGRAEDWSATLGKIKELRPYDRHVAVGFSLGANALLLLLGGTRVSAEQRVLPDAAVAVNAPIHLAECATNLKKGLNRIYDLNFVQECRRDILLRHRGEDKYKTVTFPKFGTLHDFDNWYTAPMSGFRDREDYYETCSTHDKLHAIKTPTLVLTAEDDPFVGVEAYRKAKLSDFVQLHV
ncbi:MAG: thioesterase, partial [Proteobacteria bacterium]